MKRLISLGLGFALLTTTVSCGHSRDKAVMNNQNNPTEMNSGGNTNPDVPAGKVFDTTLQQNISTGKNSSNDPFQLRVRSSLFGKNETLQKAIVHGHLEDVVKAVRGKKASLHLVFDDIQLQNGTTYPLNATLVNTQLETKTKGKFLQNAGVILGGAAVGHFIGNKTKFKHGGLTGAAAATAFVLSSPGGEVVLRKGTILKLKLQTALGNS
jgi:hypothetical protein